MSTNKSMALDCFSNDFTRLHNKTVKYNRLDVIFIIKSIPILNHGRFSSLQPLKHYNSAHGFYTPFLVFTSRTWMFLHCKEWAWTASNLSHGSTLPIFNPSISTSTISTPTNPSPKLTYPNCIHFAFSKTASQTAPKYVKLFTWPGWIRTKLTKETWDTPNFHGSKNLLMILKVSAIFTMKPTMSILNYFVS